MASVNKVILIGNLGKDPEVRHLEGGVTKVNFPLATSETYKDKSGNKIEHTEWHNIILWRGLAEVAEKYLKKGNPVFIEGKIKTRTWEDKDGNKRYSTEIIADNMTLLGGKPSGDGHQHSSSAATSSDAAQETATNRASAGNTSDDLPF